MSPEQRLNLTVLGVKPVRKKPVKVLAAEITHNNVEALIDWVNNHKPGSAMLITQHGLDALWVRTFEGWVVGTIGDVLIRGTEGEFYPIKKLVYMNVYEDVPQEG